MQVDRLQLFITLALYSLPGLVLGFTLHELMHAVAAVRLGDEGPRHDGRLSLDPLVQIDPLGFALLLGVGFGFARPVLINTQRIRTAAARALVGAAGPLTNLGLAAMLGLVLRLLVATRPGIVVPDNLVDPQGGFNLPYIGRGGLGYILFFVLYQAMFANALLFVFNMIPIPPLDGFSVLKHTVGSRIPEVIAWMERNASLLALAGLAVIFLLPRLGSNTAGNALISLVDRVVGFAYAGDPPIFSGFDSLLSALSNR